MASERALLMIADIGGYTKYMRTHRMSLAHAEVNTARLLEAVVDAAPGFELIEIEGDAAFLARDADTLDGGGQPVDVAEYVLFSEELYRTGQETLPEVREVSQELEGIGRASAFFVEVEDVAGALPPPRDPSWPSRLGRTLDVAGRGLPYMLGLRRRRRVAAQ